MNPQPQQVVDFCFPRQLPLAKWTSIHRSLKGCFLLCILWLNKGKPAIQKAVLHVRFF